MRIGIGLFRSVIATHADNGNAQYQLGKLLLDAGKVQEAVTHLEAAARALPQTVDSIEIAWPSGRKQVIRKGLTDNQTLKITEPEK